MELSPKQQINELIKNSQKILITGHSDLGGDCMGSMLALGTVLKKLGKETTIVATDVVDESLHFLPGIDKIDKDIAGTRDIVIRLDTTKTPIEKISYSKEENFLNIHITPKNGQIGEHEIGYNQGSFQYDLIFVLDTPDVEKIDSVYDRYTELAGDVKDGPGLGFFQIGGGISGDFPICVVPSIKYDLKKPVRPWGYFCQISDSTTSYGSYSGATPNEKITWDKLTKHTPMFVIESDATIVAPLMFEAILDRYNIVEK